MAFPNNSQRTVLLNTKHSIPLIGLGTTSTCHSSAREIQTGVQKALESGIRHIDISSTDSKNNNETAIGDAIRSSGIPREEIFLTTTLAREDHSRVREALEESLEKLGVEYIDALLMGLPWDSSDDAEKASEGVVETWVELQKLIGPEEKVRSIGISGFGKRELEGLLGDERCTIIPAIHQTSFHPCPSLQNLLAFNTSKGIHTTATPFPFESSSPLSTNKTLQSIAKTKGKTTQQVLQRWCLHRGYSVILDPVVTPESNGAKDEFLALDGWGLTVLEMKAIEGMLGEEELS